MPTSEIHNPPGKTPRSAARTFVLVAAVFIVLVGTVGVVAPEVFQATARYTLSSTGLLLAAAFRVAVGAALWSVAGSSRAPRFLTFLGLAAIAAGLVTALLGVDGSQRIVSWWLALGPVGIRLWPAVALVLGLLILWAVRPSGQSASGAQPVP